MHNTEGVNVDLYIPRKCNATNRLIHAKDKASVQLNIGHVNADGIYTGEFTPFAMCGFIRSMGEADGSLDRLWTKTYDEAKVGLGPVTLLVGARAGCRHVHPPVPTSTH